MPNNSITVVVSRAVKVAYAPDVDSQDQGEFAEGAFVVSWCCPSAWSAPPQPPATVPVTNPPVHPTKPMG
jgi:hypothetical protein